MLSFVCPTHSLPPPLVSVIANILAGLERSLQVRFCDLLRLFRRCAYNDLDSLLREHLLGSSTHSTGDHNGCSLFLDPTRENAGFVWGRFVRVRTACCAG